jgi:hypothetical protein
LARKSKRTATTTRPVKGGETRPSTKPRAPSPAPEPREATATAAQAAPAGPSPRSRAWTILAVIGLLVLHYGLAARSLLLENPTVDEVVHLPAGITYWQKGTFRLYHHNPPLFKLVAALPVLLAGPTTEPLYASPSWTSRDPSQTTFSQNFAMANVDRYLELFQLARLMMPMFTVVGGIVVFAWSARLYGRLAGLLSLALWVFCPNILAHARLITSDASSTAIGVAATYVFWLYLHNPTWRRAIAAGVLLGIAQLSKFSMLLLYAVWPVLWLLRLWLVGPRPTSGDQSSGSTPRFVARGLVHGAAIVALSILTIDAGYFFEGVGIPLGHFEFGSKTLTRPVPPGDSRPHSRNKLFEATWQFRVNRFRGTWLAGLPMPLPRHYLEGFDEQKIETEGLPRRFFEAVDIPLDRRQAVVDEVRRTPETDREEKQAYTVYLDGETRTTGWGTYYIKALLYKVPEGTWLLLALSLVVLVAVKRPPAGWFDELALWIVPVMILLSMSLLTDINLGLRYVLAILPYVFISMGKVVPWCLSLREPWRRITGTFIAGSLGLTIAAAAWIHPHYLAYFNWASGGPDRVPPHLIDSNLDWGQDLVELQRWCQENIPDQEIGLAYFGQINPSIFAMRKEPFRWFLPPGLPGTVHPMFGPPSPMLKGPRKLTPGYYAVSVSLLYGLPWGLYDPAPPVAVWEAIQPTWRFHPTPDGRAALGYFRQFRPIMPPIGHSIYVYRLTEEDVARVSPLLEGRSHDVRGVSSRLATDVDLREVGLSRRAEEHLDLEAGLPQPFRQIGAELGEHRVAPVPARVGDPRRAVFDAPIGPDDGAGEGVRRVRQEGHREEMTPARNQHAPDFTEGRIQVGDMLERFGGQHQVEGGIRVGQPRQVLGADTLDHRAGNGAGPVIRSREVRQAEEMVVESIDPVDLGDAQVLDLGLLDPPGQRRCRGRGGADGVERQHGLGDAPAAQLGAA